MSRIWHGCTKQGNADAYQNLLKEEIFIGISNRKIRGYRGIHPLRRDVGDAVEFNTIMWFDSIDAVREFPERTTKRQSSPPRHELCSHASMIAPNITT